MVKKWKIVLGVTVIGEVPTYDIALKRAKMQAKSSKLSTIEVVDENQETKIIPIEA